MKKNCYKRKDGRWQYSKQRDGVLYYAIANTYKELLEKIKTIKPKQRKNLKTTKTKTLTFVQYCELFYNTYIKDKNITEETKKSWIRQIEMYIKPNFQRIPLEKITAEQLQLFINKIDKERTREQILQKIKRIIQKAYITGKIKKDVSLGLERIPREKEEERPPLTYKEQKAFIEEVKKTKIYAFAMFSIIIGSRREETMKFCFEDIDEEKLTIHIRGTKTKNADRIISTTKSFIEFIKTNLPKGKFEFEKNYPTKIARMIFKKIGIKNCLHGLRHTCSANLYFLGANDKYRQMQLGHSSIVITNDIYTNIKENITKEELIELYGDLYPKFD